MGVDDSDGDQFEINSGGFFADPSDFEMDSSGNVELQGGITTTNASIGDGTNDMLVSTTGDVLWTGSGGLAFGEIYAASVADTITIITAGIASKVQVTSFDTNGLANNTTPNHTTDDITITSAGMYLAVVSLHVETAGGGGADLFGFSLYKNNGANEFANVHAHRMMAGGAGDVGSVNMSGLIDLAASDTIELWAYNEDSTDDIVIDDVTLTLIQVGGT